MQQTLDSLCGINAKTALMPTANGDAVVEANHEKIEQGSTVVLSLYGRQQFAKLMGQSFITDDGEEIEDEALDGVSVHGVLTYTINRLYEGRCIV